MLVAISQRVVKGEYREMDALEHTYIDYFSKFANLIPIPNNSEFVDKYFKLPIKRIILSGGTDMGMSKKRDDTESKLLEIAIKRKIPLLGICRGMQFINMYFGGQTSRIEEKKNSLKHVASNHKVSILRLQAVSLLEEVEVNSYHHYCIDRQTLSSKLKAFAQVSDGTLEGIYHPSLPIAGIQWHPERKSPDEKVNERLIKAFLNKKLFWKNDGYGEN